MKLLMLYICLLTGPFVANASLYRHSLGFRSLSVIPAGEPHFKMSMGYQQLESSNSLNIHASALSRPQVQRVKGKLLEQNLSYSGSGWMESYSLTEFRTTFSPSLGIRLSPDWSILAVGHYIRSNYKLGRFGEAGAELGSDRILTRAFDQNLKANRMSASKSQQRNYIQSVELISYSEAGRLFGKSCSSVVALEIPLNDSLNDFDIIGTDPNDGQIDLELGLELRSLTDEHIYLYVRNQFEGSGRSLAPEIQGEKNQRDGSAKYDAGDYVGAEIWKRWTPNSTTSFQAALHYFKKFRDKFSGSEIRKKEWNQFIDSKTTEAKEFSMDISYALKNFGWVSSFSVRRSWDSPDPYVGVSFSQGY